MSLKIGSRKSYHAVKNPVFSLNENSSAITFGSRTHDTLNSEESDDEDVCVVRKSLIIITVCYMFYIYQFKIYF